MADRCASVRSHVSCRRGIETQELKESRRPLEISSEALKEPIPLKTLNTKSILYRGEAPPSTFREDIITFTPMPSGSASRAESQDTSVDWKDILGWSLTLGAGAASSALITLGYQNDDNAMAATGTALAASALVWGISDITFRSLGVPHEMRELRLGISMGTAALTGLATWLALEYNGFDFSLEGKTFSDDPTLFLPFVPFPYVQPISIIPSIKFPPGMMNSFKNPTSGYGP